MLRVTVAHDDCDPTVQVYRPSTSTMRVDAGRPTDDELGGLESTDGIAIPIGGAHGQFDRLTEHPEDDRVFTRIVAHADRVIADLIVRPLADLAFAAMDLPRDSHRIGNEFPERSAVPLGASFLKR